MGWLRDEKVDISKYLPEFVRGDPVLGQTLAIESKEHEQQRMEIRDLLAQAFIDTATWGLTDWERILGLKPDAGDSYEQRRNRILLYLQSHQTSTKEFMSRLCGRYTDTGTAEISEDAEHYAFRVVLRGGCDDMDGLRHAVDIYKPAHLGYKVDFLIIYDDEVDRIRGHDEMLSVINAATRDEYPYSGRYLDGTWKLQLPSMLDGAWRFDGACQLDGAELYASAEISDVHILDGAYDLDGSYMLNFEQQGVAYLDSAEPDAPLNATPHLALSDIHGFSFVLDGRWPLEGSMLLGYNPIRDVLHVETHAVPKLTMNDTYPLARMQRLDGSWQLDCDLLTLDGGWSLSGKSLSTLAEAPGVERRSALLDGSWGLDGKTSIISPEKVGVLLDAGENYQGHLATQTRLPVIGDTLGERDASTITEHLSLSDDWRTGRLLDGSFLLSAGRLLNGGRLLKGTRTLNGSSRLDGCAVLDGGGRHIDGLWQLDGGGWQFNGTHALDGDAIALSGHAASDVIGGTRLNARLADAETESERAIITITSGLHLDGSWALNGDTRVFIDGAWLLDGRYTCMCYPHLDPLLGGDWVLNGSRNIKRGGGSFGAVTRQDAA